MTYIQITSEERYMLGRLRMQGLSNAAIARALGRHRSTVGREIARNRCLYDGCYRPSKAQERTNGRRRRSRRNQRISPTQWRLVEQHLALDWSPEQIAGRLGLHRVLSISHETIYRYIWRNKTDGGVLYLHLRHAQKQRRKRYAAYDSRGRLAGKRHIGERPEVVATRAEFGHWEIDTVVCGTQKACVVTLVERMTGYTLIGKLPNRTAEAMVDRVVRLIRKSGLDFHSITADNGTEFHSYARIEALTGTIFYFAAPHHAWERGTNENTNGLIRQYIPKRASMEDLTQRECARIAAALNDRPRKRHKYLTPNEVLDAI